MRIPMIAGNWKMNTQVKEAVNLVAEMQPALNALTNIERVLCPPFISIVSIYSLLQGSQIKLGAQNVYFQEKGAFTGEISPLMLKGFCEYVIIGHSERRQYFHEEGELISKKVAAALKNNLKPILCVGENLQEYEAGKTRQIVTDQMESSLAGVTNGDSLTIAYEPVWAIGTGKAATGKQANETINLIRYLTAQKFNSTVASNIRILYGGSVNAGNIAEFISQPEIDGALVGGASLIAREFINIVKITADIRNSI
jgi:triosephosphate isomerase (TIM)